MVRKYCPYISQNGCARRYGERMRSDHVLKNGGYAPVQRAKGPPRGRAVFHQPHSDKYATSKARRGKTCFRTSRRHNCVDIARCPLSVADDTAANTQDTENGYTTRRNDDGDATVGTMVNRDGHCSPESTMTFVYAVQPSS